MTSTTSQSPAEILSNFFAEMHEWEKKHYPIVRALVESDAPQTAIDGAQNTATAELLQIYDRFNISKKNRSRAEMIMLEDPPTYDDVPQIKETANVAADEVDYVVKENAGLMGTYRYKLKSKNGTWSITKREFQDPRKGWVAVAF